MADIPWTNVPDAVTGETTDAGEGEGCAFGCTMHDCAAHCDAGSDPSQDVWNKRTRHWYCPLGNDNCGAHDSSAPDADDRAERIAQAIVVECDHRGGRHVCEPCFSAARIARTTP